MTATIIDGKAIAAGFNEKIKTRVTTLTEQTGETPELVVILVGDDPASEYYVKSKQKKAKTLGIAARDILLPADTTQETLLQEIHKLNDDVAVHGILVQLPLPEHIDKHTVIEAIDPNKDVDGFHPINVGRLSAGEKALVPCTPLGCTILLHEALGEDLSGKHAVVLGRSDIVGKPMAQLLLRENCTVTIAHSRTQEIEKVASSADILIAAIGKPHIVTATWIKPGATVIDVGINRVEDKKLVGDVDFAAVKEVAGAITPVPGGVGPMTIACLMHNTAQAFCQQHGITFDTPGKSNGTGRTM